MTDNKACHGVPNDTYCYLHNDIQLALVLPDSSIKQSSGIHIMQRPKNLPISSLQNQYIKSNR